MKSPPVFPPSEELDLGGPTSETTDSLPSSTPKPMPTHDPFATGVVLSTGPFPPPRQTPPVRLAKGEGLTPEQLAERGATPIFARLRTTR